MKKLLILLIASISCCMATAQPHGEHPMLQANRVEAKLPTKGLEVLGHYANGFVPVATNYKKSFADSNGRMISGTEYTNVRDFYNGYASVNRDDGWTLIDTSGKELFAPIKEFSNIGKVINGRMIVTFKKPNKAGLALLDGAIIVPAKYIFLNTIDSLSGNYLGSQDGKYVLLDATGKQLYPEAFEDFSGEENSSCYAVKLDGEWALLNLDGTIRKDFGLPYDHVEAFHYGFAAVRKDGKVGYIDTDGNEQLPLIYDDGFEFNQFGNAPIKIGEEHAMVDTLGNIFLKGPFDLVTQLDSNLFRIVDSSSQYASNKEGKQMWPAKCYLIEPLDRDLYKVIPLTKKRIPFFADEKGKKISNYAE